MPDERRWGFVDTDGRFVEVPKQPLQLAGLMPPVEVHLYCGTRRIIEEPRRIPADAAQMQGRSPAQTPGAAANASGVSAISPCPQDDA